MWFIYAIIHVFLMAVVNFTDEKLVTDNKLPKKPNIHTKVGSILIASTLMCFMGAALLRLITHVTILDARPMYLAVISAITMVSYWASYFYLLQFYPVHQVVPLNQISSVWLLVIELLFGGSITLVGLLGIILLMYGAYILDSGTFKWQIPTRLFLIAHLVDYLIFSQKSSRMGINYSDLLLAVNYNRNYWIGAVYFCDKIQRRIYV